MNLSLLLSQLFNGLQHQHHFFLQDDIMRGYVGNGDSGFVIGNITGFGI